MHGVVFNDMEKKFNVIPEPDLSSDSKETQEKSGCCGASCGSCGECSRKDGCGDWSGREGRSCTKWWQYLGVMAGIFLAVWTVAKAVEIKRLLSDPPANALEHTLTLSAVGKVVTSPDTAEAELSVLTEGVTPEIVQQENTQKINTIIDFVRTSGVDSKDIKTATYALYPKYEYVKGQSNIVGYTLTQSLRVKVREIAKVGQILEGATRRGANQVGEVRFFLDDADAFKAEARKKAYELVRAKSEELAELAGIKLGRIVAFSESGSDLPPPIFYGRAESLDAGGAGAPPQTQSGTQDISVTVTVTYEIK